MQGFKGIIGGIKGMKIYCDGSGFNGSVSKFGIITEHGKKSAMVFNENITSNVMEYSAIIMAGIIAKSGDELFSDSQLAVNQISGT